MLTGRTPASLPRLIFTYMSNKLTSVSTGHPRQVRNLGISVVRYEEGGVKGRYEGDDRSGAAADGTSGLTEETLRQFVSSLSEEQRETILDEVHQMHAVEVKKKAEEKLASWRWRSRFGRPTSLHSSLGADPTGTYCEIPQEWLQKKVDEKTKPKPASGAQLRQLAIHNALPFVGFGFLDNLIMIVAGDYIDMTIGTTLGISTMAAAALGNTVSDLAGIGSAWYVENVAVKIGIHPPDMTQEQLDGKSARWSANSGRGAGVVIGCLIGMFPLMFLPNHEDDKKDKKDKKAVAEG